MLKSKSPLRALSPSLLQQPIRRAIPLIAPEFIALGKATLVTLGIGIIYEKGKKALDTVMMAANGNQVDTGVANQVYEKINEYFQSTGKNQINVKYCKN